jgi:hypothetical protein
MSDELRAFPFQEPPDQDGVVTFHYGMTLRDWFAGQVIAWAMNRCSYLNERQYAERAYEIADAMLEVRKQ